METQQDSREREKEKRRKRERGEWSAAEFTFYLLRLRPSVQILRTKLIMHQDLKLVNAIFDLANSVRGAWIKKLFFFWVVVAVVVVVVVWSSSILIHFDFVDERAITSLTKHSLCVGWL